jgi:hypothetical protein
LRQRTDALGAIDDPRDHRVSALWRILGNVGTDGA